MRTEITQISNFKVLKNGYDVTKLLQDVSQSKDLVSNLDNYESELLSVQGKLASAPLFAGTGFRAFQLETSAIKSEPNLQIRLPEPLIAQLGLIKDCTLTVKKGVMWRYKTRAQVSVFSASELTISSCPAPKLLKARATSDTEVELTFSRPIAPTSVKKDGSQFTFSSGLTSKGAAVNLNKITVTTTKQSPGQTYTVTAAISIKDTLGKGLDPNGNTATFKGFVQPAKLLINEVNPNISYGCDLIELRVISSGSMEGYVLQERNYSSNPLYKFPYLYVKKDELIVIHLNGKNAKCNSKGAKDELKTTKDYPKSQYPENYDTAYDIYSTDTGLTSTDNVITLYDANGKIIDAVLLTGKTSGSAASSSEAQATAVAKAKEWTDPNGKIPTKGFVDDEFHKNAAGNMKNCGKTPTGRSIQRISNTDTNTKKDWSDQHNATWGKLNPGQKPLP